MIPNVRAKVLATSPITLSSSVLGLSANWVPSKVRNQTRVLSLASISLKVRVAVPSSRYSAVVPRSYLLEGRSTGKWSPAPAKVVAARATVISSKRGSASVSFRCSPLERDPRYCGRPDGFKGADIHDRKTVAGPERTQQLLIGGNRCRRRELGCAIPPTNRQHHRDADQDEHSHGEAPHAPDGWDTASRSAPSIRRIGGEGSPLRQGLYAFLRPTITERRDVSTERKVNSNQICCAGAGVILFDGPSQSPCFDPNNRVQLRIEGVLPTESLYSNRIAFDLAAFAAQRRLDDKSKKSGQLRRGSEHVARNHALERGADLRSGWPSASFIFGMDECTGQPERRSAPRSRSEEHTS